MSTDKREPERLKSGRYRLRLVDGGFLWDVRAAGGGYQMRSTGGGSWQPLEPCEPQVRAGTYLGPLDPAEEAPKAPEPAQPEVPVCIDCNQGSAEGQPPVPLRVVGRGTKPRRLCDDCYLRREGCAYESQSEADSAPVPTVNEQPRRSYGDPSINGRAAVTMPGWSVAPPAERPSARRR